MASDPLEVLDAKLAAYRAEYNKKAVDLRELAVKIDALEEFRPHLEAATNGKGSPSGTRAAPPIRALVKSLLETWSKPFSADELVAAVQKDEPTAKETSVRAELSHCKKKGHVEQLGRDLYRSLVYDEADEDSESTEQSEDAPQDSKEEAFYGPAPGFGRINA